MLLFWRFCFALTSGANIVNSNTTLPFFKYIFVKNRSVKWHHWLWEENNFIDFTPLFSYVSLNSVTKWLISPVWDLVQLGAVLKLNLGLGLIDYLFIAFTLSVNYHMGVCGHAQTHLNMSTNITFFEGNSLRGNHKGGKKWQSFTLKIYCKLHFLLPTPRLRPFKKKWLLTL